MSRDRVGHFGMRGSRDWKNTLKNTILVASYLPPKRPRAYHLLELWQHIHILFMQAISRLHSV